MTEINVDENLTQEEFLERAEAAALVGTLQATYTDFYYLRPEWRENVEREALLGVSITGIGSLKDGKGSLNFEEAAQKVIETNARWAKKFGINPAARLTAIKPSGTTSLVLGTSSGVHAWYSPYYIRRMRLQKSEPLYKYLKGKVPQLIEDEFLRPEDTAVLSVPYSAPKDAIYRSEGAVETFKRVMFYSENWIKPGHITGANRHNVSCTINVKPDEWKPLKELMWRHRYEYTGIALLPYDSGTYAQAPFEEISEKEYRRLSKFIKEIKLTEIEETEDLTNLVGELACAGGNCEII